MKEYHLKPTGGADPEEVPFGVEEATVKKEAPVSENAKEVVRFFSGEDTDDFIEKETMVDLVAYAASMKKTLADVEAKYEKAKEEIKKRLKVESQEEKKKIHTFDNHQVIVTRKNGSAKIDWERYVSDTLGEKELASILGSRDAVSKGEATSAYISVGKPSISVEIV